MLYVALGELLIIAGLVVFIGLVLARHDVIVVDLIKQQEEERADLLTRIQRPELVQARPTPVVHKSPTPEERARARALAQVGTVTTPQGDG